MSVSVASSSSDTRHLSDHHPDRKARDASSQATLGLGPGDEKEPLSLPSHQFSTQCQGFLV